MQSNGNGKILLLMDGMEAGAWLMTSNGLLKEPVLHNDIMAETVKWLYVRCF